MKKHNFYKPPTIFDRFFKHVEEQGLELLKDDKRWIRALTSDLADNAIRELLMPYISNWKSAMKDEKDEWKKQNAGRKSANTELRIKVKGK